MSLRRLMLFTLTSKIRNIILLFKNRIFSDLGRFEADDCLYTQLNDLEYKGLLDSASLVITPNGYEETKLFSVVPNNDTGDLTVTRATRATRVNSQSLIEEVPYNRFNNSETFSASTWTKQLTTISENEINAPNGTLTADKLIGNSGVTYAYTGGFGTNMISSSILQNPNFHTVSFYLKFGGLNRVRIYSAVSTSLGTNPAYITVNLSAGTITDYDYSTVISNPFILPVTDGWYRVGFVTRLSTSTTNNRIGICLGDNTKTTGNGVDGVYIWGAQLVLGEQAQEYYNTITGFNIPKIDYTDSSCPTILVEPQRTNLMTYSEDFTNAVWGLNNEIDILDYWGISPNGIMNASLIVPTTNNATHCVARGSQAISANTYSVFAKASGYDWILLTSHSTSAPKTRGTYFNVKDGYIGNIGTVTQNPKIENYGNGWYRCTIDQGSSPSSIFTVIIANNNDVLSFSGDGSSGVFLFGTQREARSTGANVTSYIPTITSTITRNSDVISKTGVTSLIGQTEGTILIKGHQLQRGNIFRVVNSVSNINSISIFCVGINGRCQYTVTKNNVEVSNSSITPPNSQTNKNIIIKYSQTSIKVFINSVLFFEHSYATPTDFTANLDKIDFGSLTENGTARFDMIAIWKTLLTDTQCISLTSL